MKVFTYYEPVPGISLEDSTRLILLWKRNWEHFGFQPFVLNEHHARQHKRFNEVNERVSKFPTLNPKDYERSCFLRYLAMAAQDGGIMTDFDCFCYDKTKLSSHFPNKLVSFQGYIPSLVYGSRKAYEGVISAFVDYQVTKKDVSESGVPHVSDMYIFLRDKTMPYIPHDITKNFGDEGWREAPFVHFANATMNGFQPRWKNIKQLRNWEK